MLSQTQIPAGFRLPGPCVDLADQLGSQFGVPPYPLLACFTEAIGAVAGACLETDLWPEPVNGAFDVAIGVDEPEGMRLAIGHILGPVIGFQGQMTRPGSDAGPKAARPAERETLIISSSLPAQGPEFHSVLIHYNRQRTLQRAFRPMSADMRRISHCRSACKQSSHCSVYIIHYVGSLLFVAISP